MSIVVPDLTAPGILETLVKVARLRREHPRVACTVLVELAQQGGYRAHAVERVVRASSPLLSDTAAVARVEDCTLYGIMLEGQLYSPHLSMQPCTWEQLLPVALEQVETEPGARIQFFRKPEGSGRPMHQFLIGPHRRLWRACKDWDKQAVRPLRPLPDVLASWENPSQPILPASPQLEEKLTHLASLRPAENPESWMQDLACLLAAQELGATLVCRQVTVPQPPHLLKGAQYFLRFEEDHACMRLQPRQVWTHMQIECDRLPLAAPPPPPASETWTPVRGDASAGRALIGNSEPLAAMASVMETTIMERRSAHINPISLPSARRPRL